MLKDKTLKEVLEDPRIAEISKDAISKWDLSKEDFYTWTLQEIGDKNGWHNLDKGFEILFKQADRGQYYYRLYSESECEGHPEKADRNIVYLPSEDKKADERPFIFLIPGGGFVNVWSLTEGWPVAAQFNELGYHVFILTYQICVEGAAAKSMYDIARAFEIIKANKEKFHVDPDKYITCGFSAGGYVVCLWNTEQGYGFFDLKKPQASFPIYPFVSYSIMRDDDWGDEEDEKDDVCRNSTGVSLDEACNSVFNIIGHVQGFPPTALFATAEDEMVNPEHSKSLAKALEEAGIKCRLEIGPTGGHGFADGTGMCMEGWTKRAIEWYESL